VRELRRALEDLRHEKEMTDIKASRVEELEERIVELRQANRSLEEKISRLCEAPFISDAFGQHDARLNLEEAARERETFQTKIDHLQDAVRTHFAALTSLKQQAAKLREEKEEAEKVAEELRVKYAELESGTSLLQDKIRLYSGEDGVNIEDLEKALTVIKRRTEAVGRLNFLEDPEGEESLTLPGMKKKLQDVQVMNLNLTKEVERLESMLKLQANINQDMKKELDSSMRKKEKDKSELVQRASDFEDLALRRLQKIHALEAQVRELVYGLSKKKNHDRGAFKRAQGLDTLPEDASVTGSEVGTENALLNEMLEEKNGEINPDDNMLEVWIKDASIKEGVVHVGSSTFVVVDFFDYESQTTALVTGAKPNWDFAATFKITVDDFLLRHLATDVITFELNMVTIYTLNYKVF
jgi:protein fantom